MQIAGPEHEILRPVFCNLHKKKAAAKNHPFGLLGCEASGFPATRHDRRRGAQLLVCRKFVGFSQFFNTYPGGAGIRIVLLTRADERAPHV